MSRIKSITNVQKSNKLGESARTPYVDYLKPIIADGDTGFAATGCASGSDQSSMTKKCGHMSQKVLFAVSEHINRFVAARLQSDVMVVETVLKPRTDVVAASLI